MKLTTYIKSHAELELLAAHQITEVIICPEPLGRFGTLMLTEAQSLAAACLAQGIRPILEWDILMTEPQFKLSQQAFGSLDLSLFSACRLQDPGAIYWVQAQYPKLPIQLILENGNHNLIGLKRWLQVLGDQLDRLILSPEIPKQNLEHYRSELKTPIETLGLGRILLFYTPRSLVSALYPDHEDAQTKRVHELDSIAPQIEVLATSEESPHKGFPVLENRHGTFMFNTKELCLLDHLPELAQLPLDYLRIDLRWGHDLKLITQIQSLMQNFSEAQVASFKQAYPVSLIRGFFNTNKTDVLFPKLKNQRIQRQDEDYVGEVLDVVKSQYIAIFVSSEHSSLRPGMQLKLITPEGKTKDVIINELRNSAWETVDHIPSQALGYIAAVGGVSVKTAVYQVPAASL